MSALGEADYSPRQDGNPGALTKLELCAELRSEDLIDPDMLYKPELPGAHLFPEELIQHLRERLQCVTAENGRLRQALLASDARSIAAASGEPGAVPMGASGGSTANQVAARQIVALARRVRELTAEGESSKRQLQQLRRKEGQVGLEVAAELPEPDPRDVARRGDLATQLQEQLAATKLRLCEARNQCQELKLRLQQANKALEHEVGAGAGDSRRGRAQQILTLQMKVNQLQAQVRPPDSASEIEWGPRVRHEERERRAHMNKMANELQAIAQARDCARLKAETARARTKALETENSALRTRIESLVREAAQDARIIEALKAELAAITERQTAQARELTAAEQWREQCEFLRAELRRLQVQYTEAEPAVQPDKQPPSPKAADVSSEQEPSPSMDHLLELAARLEQRVTQERNLAQEAHVTLRKEQVRSARLQARLAQFEAVSKAQVAAAGNRGYTTRRDADRAADAAQLAAELMREKLLAAQAQLASIEREKQADLQLFAAALKAAHNGAGGGSEATAESDTSPTSDATTQDGDSTD